MFNQHSKGITSLSQIFEKVLEKDGLLESEFFFELVDRVSSDYSQSDIDKFLNDDSVISKLPLIRAKWGAFEEAFEMDFARSVVNKTKEVSDFIFWDRYSALVKNEIDLSEMKKESKVLIIGSGPLPITAFMYSAINGCSIDCVENKNENVLLSRQVVQCIGMENAINVYLGDGVNYNLSDYDIVFIAALALPKKLILQNLFYYSKEGCRIITRSVEGLKVVLYESIEEHLDSKFRLKRKVSGHNVAVNSSYLLEKWKTNP